MKISRILCPDSHLTRMTRITQMIDSFEQWISTDEFVTLLHLFSCEYTGGGDALAQIRWLRPILAEKWDYRKKQANAKTEHGELARWLLEDDVITTANAKLIIDAAKKQGLKGINESIFDDADYILPLGGARMSNLIRCELAARESQRHPTLQAIIAIAALRPINESEREGYVSTYAPDAQTEYDAICSGMRIAFPRIKGWADHSHEDENPVFSYSIRRFLTDNHPSPQLYALSAPSSDAKRRANTVDGFNFFFERFSISEHAKIINCTSEIFCTYQHVRSLSFALERNVNFDTIGLSESTIIRPPAHTNRAVEPVKYLQEMKATIDAMDDFLNQYS